jgi:hypothetical protein
MRTGGHEGSIVGQDQRQGELRVPKQLSHRFDTLLHMTMAEPKTDSVPLPHKS